MLSVDRLDLLRRVAEQDEDAARRALAQARQRFERQQQMHGELQRYLDDYQRGGPAGDPMAGAASVVLLENRRLFVQRLRLALQAQVRQVELAAAAVRETEAAWLDGRRALQTLERMSSLALQQARQIAERRQQRLDDDDSLQRRAAAGRAP